MVLKCEYDLPQMVTCIYEGIFTVFACLMSWYFLLKAVASFRDTCSCKSLHYQCFIAELVLFLLGDERKPEIQGETTECLRSRLVERCNNISEEVICVQRVHVSVHSLSVSRQNCVHSLSSKQQTRIGRNVRGFICTKCCCTWWFVALHIVIAGCLFTFTLSIL